MSVSFATTHDLVGSLGDEAPAVALERATDIIRREIGQQIFPSVRETVTIMGTGRRIIRLPEIPVTAVTSVLVFGQPLTAGIHWAWTPKGDLSRLFSRWAAGVPVVIDYTHGYTEVPDELTRLCAATADRILSGVIDLRQISESLGSRNRSMTYSRATDNVFSEADQKILDHYRPDLAP